MEVSSIADTNRVRSLGTWVPHEEVDAIGSLAEGGRDIKDAFWTQALFEPEHRGYAL